MTNRQIRRKFRMARLWVWWDVWARDFIVVVAIALSLWSTYLSHQQVKQVKQESTERRDQTCVIFERQAQAAVDQVVATYKYIAGLKPHELAEPLNQAVLAQLPQTVANANNSEAPPYCDQPGVGLPEPNPQLPNPPRFPRPK
jgi:hypothetical protein